MACLSTSDDPMQITENKTIAANENISSTPTLDNDQKKVYKIDKAY
jgi:hypothetical protein